MKKALGYRKAGCTSNDAQKFIEDLVAPRKERASQGELECIIAPTFIAIWVLEWLPGFQRSVLRKLKKKLNGEL